MRTGKIRNQKLEKRSLGEQGGYIGVWAMCSFILALPGSVAGQFAAGGAAAGANTGLAAGFIAGLTAAGTYAAVTYQSRKITRNLLGGQKVLIINDPDLGAVTTHAQEVIKELPASLQADVAREVEGKIWEAGEIHARTAELRKIDTRQLTAAQSAELDQTLADLASAQRELETQIIDLAAKATAAGQQKTQTPKPASKQRKP